MGSPFGNTALTPPFLVNASPVMTNAVEVELAAPVDIHRVLDEFRVFRAAEAAERQR